MDWDVLFRDIGQFLAAVIPREGRRVRFTLDQWQGLGHDMHVLDADPVFVDPPKGDHDVKPESPALRLGSKNFDLRNVGLLPDFTKQ
jgi:hypothetical protein